jgi:hypothetical protein
MNIGAGNVIVNLMSCAQLSMRINRLPVFPVLAIKHTASFQTSSRIIIKTQLVEHPIAAAAAVAMLAQVVEDSK